MTFNPPSTAQPGEPIAIIGSGCRFPGGADSPSKLWDLLSSPRDVLKEVPESRFNPDGYYHPDGDYHGHSNVRHSHMLDEDHRQFDADFFNISSNEAATIDPQQRLLLETVYESLEAAGLTIQKMKGSDTAVYVGAMCCEYSDLLIRDLNSIPVYFATGTARSIMANRLSYTFDWHGPSMTIDTACSSSLVALHQSVQALRAGTSRVAITAGANLLLGPEPYIAQSKFHMLSPTGRCHMWDSRADGYGRGDGFASLVLKTLSAAIEDGDHIECIIRETGVNQDGRTKGISMPSADAQIALIEDTYRRAGLDLNDPTQRCQFFEAHGTGTPAGDPIEAEAVHRALGIRMSGDEKMFVGSIKSLIGHTEGTAGLAGIMKVSLALQNSSILPNRLFDQISPAVKPFYGHLEVPTDVTSWPGLPSGVPRRASVNSFGFGGTNVHAIVESYEPKSLALQTNSGAATPVFAPFVFSAMTQSSLKNTLSSFTSYLKKNPSTDLHDLAWTLHSRRSVFPFRAAFHGLTVDGLRQAIKAGIDASNSAGDGELGSRVSAAGGQVLGIFTGQGAQWPGMLKELVLNSEYVKERINYLESVLQCLPASDRPSWSLKDELLADSSSSRLSEATLSQPLCTVVQIILVDLLRSANVGFSAVVGHSSGEIGAAYAAGYLSARDAIIIAYYRGLHAHLSQGNNAEKGAMMAVGISLEEGQEFCKLPEFEGQISVAACNSPSSITLSGNAEAIENARLVFEKAGKFARLLRVDKAYHSHHMIPCSQPYIDSLNAANLDVTKSTGSCVWYSSVYGRTLHAGDEIDASYWAKNMTQSVLFSQAVQAAVSEPRSQFFGALEVGPHGALKGPVEETLKDIAIAMPPYASCVVRNSNAIESFSNALGHIWKFSASSVVDLENFERTISGGVAKQPAVLKNLPKYSWDHDGALWFESRRSKALRKRSNAGHPLLGTRSVDCTEHDIVWLNNLRLSELPWLRGHQLQGQTVFPAAGYIALAIEAAVQIAGAQPIQLIEVKNLSIARPITFEDERHGVDTMFCLHVEHGLGQPGERIVADFRVNCAPARDAETVVLAGSGQIEIALGQPIEGQSLLPPRNESPPLMADVEKDNFYSALKDLGYDYSGSFQGLSSIKRKLGRGAGLVSRPIDNLHWSEENLLVHPAMLDTTFQGIFLAHSWPGDGRLWSLHVPVSIDCVRVDAAALASNKEAYLSFDSVLTTDADGSRRAQVHTGIRGDVDLFTEDGSRGLIQVEGINLVPLAPALASQDRQMFFSNVWNVASPDGELAVGQNWAPQEEIDFGWVLERVSYFYLRKLVNEVTGEDLEKAEWHHHKLLDYARHIMARVEDGTQPYGKKEWNNDTAVDLDAVMAQYPNSIEIKIMRSVGENLVAAVRGETVILQHMLKDGMLHQYYVESLGVRPFSNFIAEVVAQAAHRYPRMNILEIGAGTGGATRRVVRKLGDAFSSYTFTDISTGFFEKAKDIFSDYSDRMIFKALDAEKDITDQGYEEHSYDLIVASLVLHATKDLVYTMTNVQRLLKPGGTLVMLEVTANDTLRMSFTMGGLSGWWLGADSGRPWSPCVSTAEWHDILIQSGFSGVDTVTPTMMTLPRPFSVIVSRAVDTRIKLLEQPLLPSPESRIQDLLIIGGTTPETGTLSKEMKFLLEQHAGSINTVKSLDLIQSAEDVPAMGTIVCLADLDKPVFKDLTKSAFQGLKIIFARSRNILWLTRGCRGDDPYANMTVGFGRVVAGEMSNVRLQFIDFDKATQPDPRMLAESVLRLHITDHLQKEGRFDDVIWSTEPEIAFDNGKLLVPRVIAKKDLNDRYNSERRLISKSVSGWESRIKVGGSDGSYTLQEDILPTWVRDGAESDMVTIQVDYSSGSAIPISPKIALYPLVGRDIKTNIPLLALSESNGSSVVVPQDLVIPYVLPAGLTAPSHLLLAAYDLLAQFVLTYTEEGGTLLLLEPEPFLADVIERRSVVMGVSIACLTASSGTQKMNWKFIHPLASSRSIKMSLPPKVSTFLDLSHTAVTRKLASRITSFFPSNVKILDIPSFQSYSGYDKDSCGSSRFNLLIEALGAVDSMSSQHTVVPPVVLSPLNLNKASPVWSSITDWVTSQKLPVSINPADSVTLLRSDRTYVLVGLARGLGPSLCEWMVGQGAKYIVLTSRTPKTDQEWVSSMGAKGVIIKVYANDVSNREDLTKMITEIRETLPQIGGIANGAMVIDDTPVVEMAYEQMDKVLRPKVDGSRFLDELFYDEPLDFFILFSSLSCTFGRSGQANYIAANMYMTSLAANRRKRGLPASVIDVGAVVGIGYITREVTQKVIDQLPDAGFHFMSERDIHLSFAEAIICGYPDSGQYEELITGLRVVWGNDEARPAWYSSPRFSHTVRNKVNDPSADKNKAGAIVSVRDLLQAATSASQVVQIIQDAVIDKLKIVLQLRPEVLKNPSSLMEQGADDLGMDSLVAVEVRSWFLREFEVDMPVLKILGGATLAEIVDFAVKNLPNEFIAVQEIDEDSSSNSDSNTGPNTVFTEESLHVSTSQSSPPSEVDSKALLHDREATDNQAVSRTPGLDIKPETAKEELSRGDIDWLRETTVDESLKLIKATNSKIQAGDHISVALTGSTGFLGKSILRQLIAMDQVKKVHCLAVRSLDKLADIDSDKLFPYCGDLSEPNLGLSPEDASQIFGESDIIIHNGADVSLLKNYRKLSPANFNSTKELIRLALECGATKQFHYISSTSVGQVSAKKDFYEESLSAFTPPADGVMGYVATKWASERYLENINQSTNLPVWIHRPSTIIGEDAPKVDIMHNLLHYSKELKAVPNFGEVNGWFHFVTVEEVSKAITDQFFASSAADTSAPPVTYIHHNGAEEVEMHEFKEYMEKKYNAPYQVLEMNEWIQQSESVGLLPQISVFMTAIDSMHGNGRDLQRIMKGKREDKQIDT